MTDDVPPSGRPVGAPDGDGRRVGDRIEVRGLLVLGVHGALPVERERPQPFEVGLDLHLDLAAAARSDRLEDTVDYGEVARRAVAVVEGGPPRALLESLADAVAAAVLHTDPRIEEVTVEVKKLDPPLPFDLDSVGVRITRHR